jgi:2-polyprenyl-3-methyl-5-hydroxy-6-metoxy-1,4-benzoquinol methylase
MFMAVQIDPEGLEINALFDFVDDFRGKRVLEVGCGDGRLTWHYADQCSHVTGIDPDADDIALAIKDTPETLKDKVTFLATDILDYDSPVSFDLVILSWSL